MKGYFNNFDQSSSGLNLELKCFFDTDSSQIDFNKSMVLNKKYNQWIYSNYGNIDVSNFEKSYKVECTDVVH